MSGRLACPDCGAVPKRTADASPGAKIRCRQCGAIFRVPDDEDEYSFRHRHPRKQGGSGVLVFILILALAVPLGVLLVAAAAVLAWSFWPQEHSGPIAQAPPAALPPVPQVRDEPPPPDNRPPPFGEPPPTRANRPPPFGGDAEVGTTREIEGEDLDGKSFRLSDYRGKVVLLSFWADWCPECRAMYSHERELVKQMAGKPFALVGVNGDDDRDTAQKVREKEQLTWRSFWGGGKDGPISREWQLAGYPTLYVIDARGAIRHKFVDRPPDAELDRALEEVVKEAEGGR